MILLAFLIQIGLDEAGLLEIANEGSEKYGRGVTGFAPKNVGLWGSSSSILLHLIILQKFGTNNGWFSSNIYRKKLNDSITF